MGLWALAEMKDGEDDLGEDLLSRGACRGLAVRKSTACSGSHECDVRVEAHREMKSLCEAWRSSSVLP